VLPACSHLLRLCSCAVVLTLPLAVHSASGRVLQHALAGALAAVVATAADDLCCPLTAAATGSAAAALASPGGVSMRSTALHYPPAASGEKAVLQRYLAYPDLAATAAATATAAPLTASAAVEDALSQWLAEDWGSGVSAGDRWLWFVAQQSSRVGARSAGGEEAPVSPLRPSDVSAALSLLMHDGGAASGVLRWATTLMPSLCAFGHCTTDEGSVHAAGTIADDPRRSLQLPADVVAKILAYTSKANKAARKRAAGTAPAHPSADASVGVPACSVSVSYALLHTLCDGLLTAELPAEWAEGLRSPLAALADTTSSGSLTSPGPALLRGVIRGLVALLEQDVRRHWPETPLCEAVAQALVASPVDCRKPLAGNVVLCGGLAECAGFPAALLSGVVRSADPRITDPLAVLLASTPHARDSPSLSGAYTCSARDRSNRFAPLRPLARCLALGNIHPAVHSTFAGASAFAAAAAASNVATLVTEATRRGYSAGAGASVSLALSGAGKGKAATILVDMLSTFCLPNPASTGASDDVSASPRAVRATAGSGVVNITQHSTPEAAQPPWLNALPVPLRAALDDASILDLPPVWSLAPALLPPSARPRGLASAATTAGATRDLTTAEVLARGPAGRPLGPVGSLPAIPTPSAAAAAGTAHTPSASATNQTSSVAVPERRHGSAAPAAAPATASVAAGSSIAARLAKVQAALGKKK
jgi:hypothetical protein